MLQLDVQTGISKTSGWRAVLPDFEANLGLSDRVELDLDGAFGVEPAGTPDASRRLVADNLWLSAKFGLLSGFDPERRTRWGLGVQLGPKLPAAPGAQGVGVEALALASFATGRVHLALNAGGFVDPGAQQAGGRPTALQAGLDLNLDLDADDTVSLVAELGGTAFFSNNPHQLTFSSGLQWSPSPALDLSLIGMLGAGGADRLTVLLGVSPKVKLW